MTTINDQDTTGILLSFISYANLKEPSTQVPYQYLLGSLYAKYIPAMWHLRHPDI